MIKKLWQLPWVAIFLWTVLSWLFCWSQSPLLLSVLFSMAGAATGTILAFRLQDVKFPLVRLWALVPVLMVAINLFTDFARWLSLPSYLLSPGGAYRVTDALFWGLEVFLVVFLLRFTSHAKSSLIGIELLVAGGLVVSLFAAHRDGYLNRPYELVDPLWARGIDPMPVFLAFGVMVTGLILLLAATHSKKRGRWLDIVGLFLLLGALFLFAPLDRLKDLPKPTELQLGKDTDPYSNAASSSRSRQTDGEGQGQSGDGQGSGQQSGQGRQQSSGQSSGGQDGQQTSGQSSGGQGQQQSSGQSSGGQGMQQSSGQSSGGQGQQQSSGQSSGGQGMQQSSGQSSGGQGQQQSSGQSSGGQGQQQSSGQSSGGQGQQTAGQTSGGQDQQGTGSSGGQGHQSQSDGGQGNSHDKSPNSGQGGNSDELSFNDVSNQNSDNPPVAVVIFRDDYSPDTGMYYFRQEAFSEYNGTKLVADPSGLYDRDTADEFPGNTPVDPKVPQLDGKLFKPLETRVALIKDHAKPFGLVNPTEWRSIPNPDPKRFQKAYEVSSLVLNRPINEILGHQAGDPSWSKDEWTHYTTGPDDPRYAALLKEIEASYPDAPRNDPLIRALMVKLWLEEHGVYSLHSKHEGSADPTADFLFGDRIGYCVYFAHAAAYLYRAAGMPARVGSGYAVEVSQRGNGSSLIVPAHSAHSWPEVYLQGLGWVVLDIAPQRTLDPPPNQVDQGLQQMLGEMARQDPDEPPPDPAEQKVDLQQALQRAVSAVAHALPWALLLSVLVAFGYKIFRRFRPYFCSTQKLPEAAFRSLLDQLCDTGFVRAEGEPRASFARRLGGLSPAFHRITNYHLRRELGDPRSVPDYPWKETYLEARREIRRGFKAERLWKGFLNPINWMKVH